jgi:hypothetical protein
MSVRKWNPIHIVLYGKKEKGKKMENPKSKTCYVELNDTLGGMVQATPFFVALRHSFDEIIGINKNQIADDSYMVLASVLDSIIRVENAGSRKPGSKYFKVPDHDVMRANRVTEYTEWFHEYGMDIPDSGLNYSVGVSSQYPAESFDILLWGGRCPGENKSMWPYWEELADQLSMNNSVGFIGRYDNGREDGIFKVLGQNIPIVEVGLQILSCKCFIGNDGGLSKYASALGNRTFVITGPGDFQLSYLTNSNLHISASVMNCSPCYFDPSEECSSHMCLRNQTPDFIADTVKKIGWAK